MKEKCANSQSINQQDITELSLTVCKKQSRDKSIVSHHGCWSDEVLLVAIRLLFEFYSGFKDNDILRDSKTITGE